jgi:hypothetical protein
MISSTVSVMGLHLLPRYLEVFSHREICRSFTEVALPRYIAGMRPPN